MICPNCQKEIPNTAKACGHCGYWLSGDRPAGFDRKLKSDPPWLLIGVGGTIIVFLVGVIAFMAGGGGRVNAEATVAAALTGVKQTEAAERAATPGVVETEPPAQEPTAAPTEAPSSPTVAAAAPEAPPPPTATSQPTATTGPVVSEPGPEITTAEAQAGWASSGHARRTDEAFIHWNGENPPEVPTGCAKCHSLPGFLDFLGADDSAPGEVDRAAPIGTAVECEVCHHQAALNLDSVMMPSGARVAGLGREAVCVQCHQGRQSSFTINEVTAGIDEDTVSQDLGFVNIHYYPAAATKYGTLALGGYQYPGKSYVGDFAHVEPLDTCIGCHDPHTLRIDGEGCRQCHPEISDKYYLENIRRAGSTADYDGDGNTTIGIYYEIRHMQEKLDRAIRAYAGQVAGRSIVYQVNSYPYFFVDANANGQPDENEADSYDAWTPRLLKAAYNYQASTKDPGAFAHNPQYIIQLLYDSIEDLNKALAKPVDLTKAQRDG